MKTILVRAPNWIGDQILAYPFFYYLRKSYPNAKIISACVSWVKDIQFLNCVDDVFVLPKAELPNLLSRFKAVNEAAHQFCLKHPNPVDLAITLPNSFSTAWFLKRIRAKKRRGYSTEARGFLLNESLKWNETSSIHRSEAYLGLLPDDVRVTTEVRDFWGIFPENELDEKIPGELENFPAQIEWKNSIAHEPPVQDYAVFAPGATADSRRWSLDRFIELMKKVHQLYGWRIVLVGGPQEAPLVSKICDRSGFREGNEILNYVAKGSVSSLWKIFRNTKITVCNESGLSHVASLCGSKVQVICGAADPRRTKPIGPGDVQVALNSVDCWPCEKNVCSQTGANWLQCLNGIGSDRVWEEMKNVI